MWDDFWRAIIFIALVSAIVASCQGCVGGRSKEAKQVDDMSDSCKHGLKMAEVSQDDDDKRIVIVCAEPPKR
jgi:hypothetical protein